MNSAVPLMGGGSAGGPWPRVWSCVWCQPRPPWAVLRSTCQCVLSAGLMPQATLAPPDLPLWAPLLSRSAPPNHHHHPAPTVVRRRQALLTQSSIVNKSTSSLILLNPYWGLVEPRRGGGEVWGGGWGRALSQSKGGRGARSIPKHSYPDLPFISGQTELREQGMESQPEQVVCAWGRGCG